METSFNTQILYYISVPTISALIGWFTNYIAVKMLFRPRAPYSFLGIKLQGLVPRRQKELAEKIAETVEEKLISHKDIQIALQKEDAQKEIRSVIEKQIDLFLKEKLSAIPMVGMFLQGDLANQIKAMLINQMNDSIPEFIEAMLSNLDKNMSFKEIVKAKVEAFDLSQLEEIIYSISAKELRTIEILGGVLGFIIGIAQLFLVISMP